MGGISTPYGKIGKKRGSIATSFQDISYLQVVHFEGIYNEDDRIYFREIVKDDFIFPQSCG